LPWSEWNTTPATAGIPPWTVTAIRNAVVARAASWCWPTANPTIRRDAMSKTLSR